MDGSVEGVANSSIIRAMLHTAQWIRAHIPNKLEQNGMMEEAMEKLLLYTD
jgi:translation initiation factor IF-1